MSARILMVLTSHEWVGNTGVRTGAWLQELAAPYVIFKSRGWSIDFASPRGGSAPLDPQSLEESGLQREGRQFLKDESAVKAVQTSHRLADVESSVYDVVYLVGGTGTAWDFPIDPDIRRLIEDVNMRNGIASAICHGVLGLGTALGADGLPILKGRRATGLSVAEDELAGLDRVIPVLPEIWLKKAGALYSAAAPFMANVAIDGNVFTGQNPASALPLAEAIADALPARLAAAASPRADGAWIVGSFSIRTRLRPHERLDLGSQGRGPPRHHIDLRPSRSSRKSFTETRSMRLKLSLWGNTDEHVYVTVGARCRPGPSGQGCHHRREFLARLRQSRKSPHSTSPRCHTWSPMIGRSDRDCYL